MKITYITPIYSIVSILLVEINSPIEKSHLNWNYPELKFSAPIYMSSWGYVVIGWERRCKEQSQKLPTRVVCTKCEDQESTGWDLPKCPLSCHKSLYLGGRYGKGSKEWGKWVLRCILCQCSGNEIWRRWTGRVLYPWGRRKREPGNLVYTMGQDEWKGRWIEATIVGERMLASHWLS